MNSLGIRRDERFRLFRMGSQCLFRFRLMFLLALSMVLACGGDEEEDAWEQFLQVYGIETMHVSEVDTCEEPSRAFDAPMIEVIEGEPKIATDMRLLRQNFFGEVFYDLSFCNADGCPDEDEINISLGFGIGADTPVESIGEDLPANFLLEDFDDGDSTFTGSAYSRSGQDNECWINAQEFELSFDGSGNGTLLITYKEGTFTDRPDLCNFDDEDDEDLDLSEIDCVRQVNIQLAS